jgi:hypothetical protein
VQSSVGLNVVDSDQKSRSGRVSKFYDVTLFGLLFVIGSPDVIKNFQFRLLVSRYRDLLPDIFDRWSIFMEEGIEDLAILRLVNSPNNFGSMIIWRTQQRNISSMSLQTRRHPMTWLDLMPEGGSMWLGRTTVSERLRAR